MPRPGYLETVRNTRYKDALTIKLRTFAEQYAYNEQGDLILRETGLNVSELMERYGTSQEAAIQITDTTIVSKRARQLKEMFRDGARAVGYPEHLFEGLFASKVNFVSSVTATALQHLGLETSGELDLVDFERLATHGVVRKDLPIKCNGFKVGSRKAANEYAARTVDLHNKGFNITPILDQGELAYYQNAAIQGKMKMGLRLKFGPVDNDRKLAAHRSRFGFDWNGLEQEAALINTSPNLELTTLHAMISAAVEIKPEEFVRSALFAVEKWAKLKRLYPTMSEMDIGGGIPAMDSGYPYQKFIQPYLRGVMEICKRYQVALPKIVVESGSFVAADCDTLVFDTVTDKTNDSSGVPWVIINGTLMSLPDIFIERDPFTFVAVNHGNDPTMGVTISDKTCDSNLFLPRDNSLILMPKSLKNLRVAVIDAGAYQNVLGSVGGPDKARMVGHNGIPEPVSVIVRKDRSGKVIIWANMKPTMHEMSDIAGYSSNMLEFLKK